MSGPTFNELISGHYTIPAPQASNGGTINFNFDRSSPSYSQPREPFSTVPFLPDQEFVERPGFTAWLREKCQPGSRVALIGLGGVGKSQLAIHHAHHVREESPSTYVFWVHAGTRLRFEESYRVIADRLQLPGRANPKTNLLRLVYNWLCSEENVQWLMVIDNADDINVFYPKGRDPLASFLPQSRNGRILVTSRSRDAAERLIGSSWNVLSVSEMNDDQARQLLRTKLRDKYDENVATSLVHALECMPLAITHAAAYILRRAPRMSPSKYLDQFRKSDKKKASLLNRDIGDLRRDPTAANSVVTTWQITFEQIQQERQSAAELLSFMSLFEAQGIPEWVLRSYQRMKNKEWIDVYSNMPSEDEGADNESEGESRNNESADERGDEKSEDELADNESEDESKDNELEDRRGDEESEDERGDIEPEDEPRDNESEDESRNNESEDESRNNESENESGDEEFEDDVEMLQGYSLVAIQEDVYELHALVQLCTRVWLSDNDMEKWKRRFLQVMSRVYPFGEYENWIKCQQLEPHIEKLIETEPFCKKDAETWAQLLTNAGWFRWQTGRYRAAETMLKRAVTISEGVFGITHTNTLLIVGIIAVALQKQGKYEEAEQMNRQVLSSREKVLGKDHPHTLIIVSNLALVLDSQGKHGEAEQMNRRVLSSREKVLGKDHPDTLVSVWCLASLLDQQNRLVEADELYHRAYQGFIKTLGPSHPNTLRCENHHASLKEKMALER